MTENEILKAVRVLNLENKTFVEYLMTFEVSKMM